MADEEGIVDTTADRVLRVVEQTVEMPWPEGDEVLEWELDGHEGYTTWLTHVIALAHRADPADVAALVGPLTELADQRWGAHHTFDATRHTDDASTDPSSYDRRSAPASLVRSLGAVDAVWWRHARHAVVLVDSTATAPDDNKLAVLVMPDSWLATPLVDEFLSGDKKRVISALWEVMATRDPKILAPLAAALPTLRKATEELDLGGALVSNASNLDRAFARIQLFADGVCLCTAYPPHLLFNPVKEEHRGHIRVVGTVPNERQWEPDRICECTDCGRRYQVEQGEYHYTWWQWTPLG